MMRAGVHMRVSSITFRRGVNHKEIDHTTEHYTKCRSNKHTYWYRKKYRQTDSDSETKKADTKAMDAVGCIGLQGVINLRCASSGLSMVNRVYQTLPSRCVHKPAECRLMSPCVQSGG